MTRRRRIEASDVGLAPPGRRRGSLIPNRKRALACRVCGLVVARGGGDEERMRRWHTPGLEEHDCDGEPEKLDSMGEAMVYMELARAERSGRIRELRRQVVYPIEINGRRVGRYTADFVLDDGGRERVVDVKGYDTELARFRRKVVEALHEISIEIWTGKKAQL